MPSSESKVPVEVARSAGNEDLSQEIARTVSRKPLEQVTCRKITQHHYRCNWWTPQNTTSYDNPAMKGSLVTTSRISRSQFLHVIKVDGDLKVRVV